MGRISLPKKISNKTILKFFMLSVLLISAVFLYPYEKNENSSTEVLQAATATPTPVYKIDNYIMKDVIKPACDDNQPFMDFFCQISETSAAKVVTRTSRVPTFGVTNDSQFQSYLTSGITSSTTTQNSGVEYYGNPVLEEVNGRPILAYYGGIYEVVLDQAKQSVVNISRTFKTVGNVGYTAGCKSSWFPSSVGKKGNSIVFGSGGLEDLVESRCFDQQVTSGGSATGFGTTIRGDVECKKRADTLGIPLVPGCKLSATSSCWNRSYQCQTLNGFTMYYNIPFISRLTFGKKTPDQYGSVLNISAIGGMKVVPSSGGAATADAYTFCRGKTKNDCSDITAELAYGTSYVLRCSDTTCNDYATNNPPQYGMPVSLGGTKKTFYKRVYSKAGYNPNFQDSTDLKFIYGGFDTPYAAYIAPRRVDLFQIDAPFWRGGTVFAKYRLAPTLYDGMKADPAPYLLGLDWINPVIEVKSNALQDFVSDKYYYSLQYQNKNLILTRFKVTGYCGPQWPGVTFTSSNPIPANSPCKTINTSTDTTTYTSISLPGIDLSYTRNVTFAINSAEDVDFMIAPNFKDSLSNPNAKTRVFRAQKFNSVTGVPRLFELTPSNGGYQFLTVGPGNNAPLTFRYYNNTDADTSNDYAVFASRNYVFTSKVPVTTDCTLINNLVVANTNPNSINKGITPTSLNAGDASFALNLNFATPLSLQCPTGVVPIPAGTPMTITLYDAISTMPIKTFENVTLGSNRISLKIPNAVAPSNSKYLYTASFDYGVDSYDTNLSSNTYFTLESFANFNAMLSSPGSLVATPLANPKITITKTFGAISKQSAANLSSDTFTLTSYALPASSNFFFDHNLVSSGAGLTDQVNYKVCFVNTADTKILSVDITRDETVIPTTSVVDYSISNNCLTFNYKYPDTDSGYFMEPIAFTVYLTEGALVAPTTYNNFKVNGNVMIKNTPDMTRVTKTSKKNQGVYVAGTDKGEKSFLLTPVLASSYFKIPYYDNLVSAFNFEVVPDLLTSIQNYTLISDTSPLKSPVSFDKIDAFAAYPAQAPHVVYIAKNKSLIFDLKDQNIAANDFDGYYFVSATQKNAQERIQFYVNCSSPDYSLICQDKVEYHFKGGLYGNFKITGNLNSANQNRAFVVINQNPGILIQGQTDSRDKRYFNFTQSKTIFKYLNQ